MKILIINLFLSFSTLLLLDGKTNFVLVMTDDQGWGQTGYYNHPVLKTPNLDKMASCGLRLDRFYAGGPVCSPTRATVLTGRTHDRTGVFDHGYALRTQEKTLPQALLKAGYSTGHFGKWHLSGLRGAGVPILKTDPHGPHVFGFERWLSVTNFFDLNPIMSRQGKIEEFKGDSSEIIVEEALKFMEQEAKKEKPFFCVIWYGTPHSPWMALEEDRKEFKELDKNSQDHYAELKAMDRSIGTLRKGLKDMEVDRNTLVWFTSDNGGLPKINPSTTGGLRDYKGSLYEGGIRVPSIIEWPSKIKTCRISKYPSGSVDIFPTIADIAGIQESAMLNPMDGVSLTPLFSSKISKREKPLVFSSRGRMAIIDNDWKMISQPKDSGRKIEMYNLLTDSTESNNEFRPKHPQVIHLRKILVESRKSIEKSVNGKDYPSGSVLPQPTRIFWTELPEYKKYLRKWKDRPEYKSILKKF